MKHTDKELLDFYRERSGTEEHASYFVNKYAVIYRDIMNDPDYLEEGEELHVEALNHTNEFYLKKFLGLIKIGHSPDWANLLAGNSEMEEIALGETFKTSKEIDAEEAKKQLKIFCISIGKEDPLFIEYFIQLFNEGEYDNAVENSDNYVRAYKKQIAAGKSEVFARAYAEEASTDEFSDLGCYAYADAFEKAILDGKSEKYALVYSNKYAEMIANKYSNYSEREEDILYDEEHQKILEGVAHLK